MLKSLTQLSGEAATWHPLDLRPAESVEEGLRRLFTTPATRLLEIALARQPFDGDDGREDVAYVLRAEGGMRRQGSGAEASVVFLRHASGESDRVAYCLIQEDLLPFAFDCPRAMLERLAPACEPLASIWREQCWQRIRHPLRDGDVVTFTTLAPGIASPLLPAAYRVQWRGGAAHPTFIHLQSGRTTCIPLWRKLPYTLHYLGEWEVVLGACSECGTALGGPGAVCSGCAIRYLERQARFSAYARLLEEKLADAPYSAVWVPDRSVEGVGYYLSRLHPPLRGSAYRLSKIDLFVPGGGEIAQVWLGRTLEGAVQRAVEAAGGFPLSLVPVESWENFDPHPFFAALYAPTPVDGSAREEACQ